ncbi:putative tRNA pseudouridine synthase C25B8.05 isoform X4 [Panicum virgatum]|uniref:putative tRNA pseudouridine synthase C25B8.05 isoform X4 n=1 Tax=Panicum virgatum TaxID=38727 RepID=UPI0019D4FA8A|nr:putative tRNA pseudouridine synthase C25B8.05 isoform X4 [Panicum virgatum]
MAAAETETAAALQEEVNALQMRVQELERENQRLVKVASSCTCGFKDGSVGSIAVASSCLYGSNPEAQRDGKFHQSSALEKDLNAPFDHTVISTKNEIQCSRNVEGNGLPDDSSKRTKRRGRQDGILSHCSKRLVALKVMYFGQRFYGFSSEGNTEPTVESEIFKALERAKLMVGSRKESCYSRCGRTDKGVSASGQVISLYLRSNIKDVGGDMQDERSEIDYVKVLNRILPQDIRVLGWCPIPADFHARFTCLGREYKYLFWKGGLDILEMQKAASKFVGEHDFRNFCKMDAANVIDSLLDITKTPRKPQYKMAAELPLILRSCLFDKADFMCSSDASRSLTLHLNDEYHHYMLQAEIFHEALSCLPFPESNSLEKLQKKRNHIPLLSRQTEPSYEERIAKVKTKLTDNLSIAS